MTPCGHIPSASATKLVDVDPASRLLRLLSLLQSRPSWRGDELAARLGVTARTLRRDVARLRDIGYPVDASPGTGQEGGYRLGPGGRLPPLLLDDDEAVAITLGLRVATATSLAGVEAAAVAALTKLEQVLPARLRERVTALSEGMVNLGGPELPQVDADVLLTVATACRRGEGVRFGYESHSGHRDERSVEPLQVVHTGRRWYLVARDRDRQAWRTFRVDRISEPVLTGHRYTFDDPPDPAAMVSEGTNVAPWTIEAKLRLDAPPDEARRYYPPTFGVVEADPDDAERCVLRVGANELAPLVSFVAGVRVRVEVLDPPELRDAVAARARQLLAANTRRRAT